MSGLAEAVARSAGNAIGKEGVKALVGRVTSQRSGPVPVLPPIQALAGLAQGADTPVYVPVPSAAPEDGRSAVRRHLVGNLDWIVPVGVVGGLYLLFQLGKKAITTMPARRSSSALEAVDDEGCFRRNGRRYCPVK